MATFKFEPPIEIIESLEKLNSSTYEMMGNMTRAGAKEVYKNVVINMKHSFKDSSNLERCLKLTRTYRTPSDGGINTKIGIYGYFINQNGQKVAAPLVANTKEFGRRKPNGNGIIQPVPFFRIAFKKDQIERAMLNEKDKYLPKE